MLIQGLHLETKWHLHSVQELQESGRPCHSHDESSPALINTVCQCTHQGLAIHPLAGKAEPLCTKCRSYQHARIALWKMTTQAFLPKRSI